MATNFQKLVEEQRREQSNSIPAQRLIEKLELVKTHIAPYQRRWFWELLQNASDYNTSVDIIVEIGDDHITFKHNGEPFSVKDMLNLVRPDSNKNDDPDHEDNIGKFGTGLISTHILSSVISIDGVVKEDKLRSFNVKLDRGCYLDKQQLIKQIEKTNNELDASYVDVTAVSEFSTIFSYDLTKPLPNIPRFEMTDEGLQYIYDMLPYTMCFLQKVKSVTIHDVRRGDNKIFNINLISANEDIVQFAQTIDGQKISLSFSLFSQGSLQTVINCNGHEVLPYPENAAKIFCGLPMVGTESIGLPIILNSLAFEPSTERDCIELVPLQNETNREIMRNAVTLYHEVLKYVEDNCLEHAYNIAFLREKYNCTPLTPSNQQFNKLFVEGAAGVLKNARILKNANGEFIELQNAIMPFEESNPNQALYDLIAEIEKDKLPQSEDYIKWFNCIDFNLLRINYKSEQLIKFIEEKANISNIATEKMDVCAWLIEVISYLKSKDAYVATRYKLLPSQTGKFENASNLCHDDDIPQVLKDIYDILRQDKIESALLDTKFDKLGIVSNIKGIQEVAKVIDNELRQQYSASQANTQTLIRPLNLLYSWLKEQRESKKLSAEYLHGCFPWFYPKQATLIVDMLTDKQREQVLILTQSDSMGSLSQLAGELSKEELEQFANNLERFRKLLNQKQELLEITSKEGSTCSISLSDTSYAGLTTMQMAEALTDAKRKVREELERQGYDFSNATGLDASTFGNIYGVTKGGEEYPLVVHSYKNNNRGFQLTAMDWEQLMQPNSMLYIVTHKGAECVRFYDLMKRKGIINLSFEVENVECKHRMTALAEILRYFKGLHFDFGSLQDTFSNVAERFNVPEKEITEFLKGDDAEKLLE